MATFWEKTLESEDLNQDADSELAFETETYDELHSNDEVESDYYEFLSSTRKLPSAQWGLDSCRDPAQKAEWE